MNIFEQIENEVNFSQKWFENFKLKNPSYYHIESYIAKLYEVIKAYKAKTEVAQNDLINVKHKADILRVDLAGALKSDFEKKLDRYRDKWISYHEAVDQVKKQFLDIVKRDLS